MEVDKISNAEITVITIQLHICLNTHSLQKTAIYLQYQCEPEHIRDLGLLTL